MYHLSTVYLTCCSFQAYTQMIYAFIILIASSWLLFDFFLGTYFDLTLHQLVCSFDLHPMYLACLLVLVLQRNYMAIQHFCLLFLLYMYLIAVYMHYSMLLILLLFMDLCRSALVHHENFVLNVLMGTKLLLLPAFTL